jgi:hypothetical protein
MELLNDLKLESLNMKRSYLSLYNKTNDYKRMMKLIAESDVPRLHNLFNTCMKQGHGKFY